MPRLSKVGERMFAQWPGELRHWLKVVSASALPAAIFSPQAVQLVRPAACIRESGVLPSLPLCANWFVCPIASAQPLAACCRNPFCASGGTPFTLRAAFTSAYIRATSPSGTGVGVGVGVGTGVGVGVGTGVGVG